MSRATVRLRQLHRADWLRLVAEERAAEPFVPDR